MQKYHSELIATLGKMNDEFTSHDFSYELQKLGVPRSFSAQGNIAEYLHKHCEHISRKNWRKRLQNAAKQLHLHPILEEDRVITPEVINAAIQILKKKGYKILKQKIEFEEI